MRPTFVIPAIGLLLASVQFGCVSPAPRTVRVPPREASASAGSPREQENIKPLPHSERSSLPKPYDDVPLVSQRPPEQKAYLDAYERVGRPRLMIIATGPDGSSSADKSYSVGNIDYSAVETILADWLSANGAVNILSSSVAPAAPVEPTSRPAASPEADADVLVRLQVHPAHSNVSEARLITEAINTRGGESIARAVVDVPTPLEKERLNEATRFVARKLMDEMTESWSRMVAAPHTSAAAPTAPPPAAAPTTPAAPIMPPPPPRNSGPTPPTIVIPPPPTTTTTPAR